MYWSRAIKHPRVPAKRELKINQMAVLATDMSTNEVNRELAVAVPTLKVFGEVMLCILRVLVCCRRMPQLRVSKTPSYTTGEDPCTPLGFTRKSLRYFKTRYAN
jgi:hypothetical protein